MSFSLRYKPTVLDGGHVLRILHEYFATKSQRLKEEKKHESKILMKLCAFLGGIGKKEGYALKSKPPS